MAKTTPVPNEINDDAMARRDHRSRHFIQEAADGLFETDLQGNFIFLNPALCRIFGRGEKELLGRGFREFMDKENARFAFESFNRIYRTGEKRSDLQWEIIHRDGRPRVVEISGNLISSKEGRKIGFRGIARDVTDKDEAKRALEASERCNLELYKVSRRMEKRYLALLKFLPDPVFAFDLKGAVAYINPAFEKVFGWTYAEMRGKKIPFIPDDLREQTREGFRLLLEEKVVHGFETRRLTRDGRLLNIILDGAIFYDEDDRPAGQVLTLRDITREKRVERNNQTLFRIANALPRFRGLDALLEFITKEAQDLVKCEGASVILLDDEKKEFFFRVAAYEDSETGRKMKEIRFPADKGVAGHVYRTGKPLIVEDTSKSPYFFQQVDEQSEYRTRSMLDAPVRNKDRFIGVLCVVNKKEGAFDQTDVELISAIGAMVALPIENARINEALNRSYEEVRSLSRAKDRVIHHLSHELKTPVSVLSASLGLLRRRLAGSPDPRVKKILDRLRRNLQRILHMQYEIEDLMRERNYQARHMLSKLLEVCTDELEALAEDVQGEKDAVTMIRDRIEEIFGPGKSESEDIRLDRFLQERVESLRPRFAHRDCELDLRVDSDSTIRIPPDVLAKVVDGLIRNAVEYTPDGGRITVAAHEGENGPELMVRDRGVGITPDNQTLLFENYFTSYDTLRYSSREPFDFNAGGKGFDLLRMKIFSER
ncbi:MAG: PAS domain S-box protein, partial [Desulfobacterales bacterium]|nr:PAS domain S-box protein [Desulfobacterales bacterium]